MRMRKKPVPTVPAVPAVLPLLLGLAACASSPSWRSVTHDAPFEDIWVQFVQIAAANGYALDEAETDRGQRIFVSTWRTVPASFRGASRSRVHARFERPEGETSGWMIEFYVEKQSVDDPKLSFDPIDADWDDAGQDGQREDILLGQTRLAFGQDLGLEPSYRQGH